jgi:hypothetical protein
MTIVDNCYQQLISYKELGEMGLKAANKEKINVQREGMLNSWLVHTYYESFTI